MSYGDLRVVLLLLSYIVCQPYHFLGDDNQALIWDIHSMPRPVDDPILAYQAEGEVNTWRVNELSIMTGLSKLKKV
uniref:Uncharacterized protein n=1 Tax=Parascaris equorum TaxID=6256 RepID=A0A914S394_PAREQ